MQAWHAPPPAALAARQDVHRLGVLKAAAGAGKTITPYDRDLNNKFILVSIE